MNDPFVQAILEEAHKQEEIAKWAAKMQVVNGAELAKRTYPEPRWLWDKIIPDSGLALLLAGKALGKTIFAIQLSDAISRGRPLFGIATAERTKTLFVEVEMNEARTMQRLRFMGISVHDYISYAWDTPIGEDGLRSLTARIIQDQYKFVVIDVLQAFWPRKYDSNNYQDAYDLLLPLRQLANSLQCLILMITHARKADSDDWGDATIGSTGIKGNCDVILRIVRARGADEAILKISGNVGEDREISLQFIRNPLSFVISDVSPAEIGQTQERREILDAIRELGGTARPGQVAEILGKERSNISHTMQKMARIELLDVIAHGVYSIHGIHTIHNSSNMLENKAYFSVNAFDTGIHTIHDGTINRQAVKDVNDVNKVNDVNDVNTTFRIADTKNKSIEQAGAVRLGKPAAEWPAFIRQYKGGNTDDLEIF